MHKMKAVLLAAGKGERLGAVTSEIPKPMVPVSGKPVIEWNIWLCKKHGITDLFINLFHLPEVIRRHLGNGDRFGVSITYATEIELLGTAGGVKQFSAMLNNTPFYVVYSDNMSDCDLEAMHAHHVRREADMCIALFHQEDVRHSGVAVLDDQDNILEFVEKPQIPPENCWANAGIYLIEPYMLARIPEGHSDFARDVIPGWIKDGYRVVGSKMEGGVVAIDTPELLEKANLDSTAR